MQYHKYESPPPPGFGGVFEECRVVLEFEDIRVQGHLVLYRSVFQTVYDISKVASVDLPDVM